MENPGKIGHKTHHDDKRKKQRKNYNDIFYLHDSNFDVFFSFEIWCLQTALALFERSCHSCSLNVRVVSDKNSFSLFNMLSFSMKQPRYKYIFVILRLDISLWFTGMIIANKTQLDYFRSCDNSEILITQWFMPG